MLTIDDFFSIASPTTLASLVSDVQAAGTGANRQHLELERTAFRELVALVGEAEAADLIEKR